jgi:hypothetical protein
VVSPPSPLNTERVEGTVYLMIWCFSIILISPRQESEITIDWRIEHA